MCKIPAGKYDKVKLIISTVDRSDILDIPPCVGATARYIRYNFTDEYWEQSNDRKNWVKVDD